MISKAALKRFKVIGLVPPVNGEQLLSFNISRASWEYWLNVTWDHPVAPYVENGRTYLDLRGRYCVSGTAGWIAAPGVRVSVSGS